MNSSPESLLNRLFGRHCGLNADWSVCAWRVSGNLYDGLFITDDEDGSFSLVRSTSDVDGDCHATETIATVDASLVAALVVIARTNAEIAAKGLLPLCGEQIAFAGFDGPARRAGLRGHARRPARALRAHDRHVGPWLNFPMKLYVFLCCAPDGSATFADIRAASPMDAIRLVRAAHPFARFNIVNVTD